jgi:putative membrane protein
MTTTERSLSDFDPRNITRPDPVLLNYYLVVSLLTTVAFPFVFLPLFFKFKTLQYRFDDEGIAMSWGILFRKEVYLTYRRIQDIHVTRNLLHRWMGLAAIAVQTASGTAGAEMTIEGIREVDALRDYLYAKMRGAKGEPHEIAGDDSAPQEAGDEALALLREIRDTLKNLAERRR